MTETNTEKSDILFRIQRLDVQFHQIDQPKAFPSRDQIERLLIFSQAILKGLATPAEHFSSEAQVDHAFEDRDSPWQV